MACEKAGEMNFGVWPQGCVVCGYLRTRGYIWGHVATPAKTKGTTGILSYPFPTPAGLELRGVGAWLGYGPER